MYCALSTAGLLIPPLSRSLSLPDISLRLSPPSAASLVLVLVLVLALIFPSLLSSALSPHLHRLAVGFPIREWQRQGLHGFIVIITALSSDPRRHHAIEGHEEKAYHHPVGAVRIRNFLPPKPTSEHEISVLHLIPSETMSQIFPALPPGSPPPRNTYM